MAHDPRECTYGSPRKLTSGARLHAGVLIGLPIGAWIHVNVLTWVHVRLPTEVTPVARALPSCADWTCPMGLDSRGFTYVAQLTGVGLL